MAALSELQASLVTRICAEADVRSDDVRAWLQQARRDLERLRHDLDHAQCENTLVFSFLNATIGFLLARLRCLRAPFEGLPKRVGQPALGPLPQNPSLLLAGPGPALPKPLLLSTGPGRPGPPNPSLLSTGLGRPGPQIPHFYRRALGPRGPPKSLTFIDGARPPKPLTSIGQSPRFYQPGQTP